MVKGKTDKVTAIPFIVYNYKCIVKIYIIFFLQAIDRLGGQQMKQECDHMKTKTLDSTIQEIMMDIKCSNSEIMDTEESFEWTLLSCIQMKHYIYHQQLWNKAMEIKTSQNDTVPWNIRGKQFVLSDLGYN